MNSSPGQLPASTSASSQAQLGRPRLGHRLALDGLRGVAVLAVLANHLHLPFFEQGALGVDVFFALSGFLITSVLCEEWCNRAAVHLPHFYLRRVLRLYPALLGMVFLVAWITPAKSYVVASLTYTTNWLMAFHLQPFNLELGHTWSLAIEEQYYLFWPPILILLLRYLHPKRAVLVPVALGLASAILRAVIWTQTNDFWRVNAGIDSHADGLLLGSALGIAFVFNLLPRAIQKGSVYLLILCVVILFSTNGFFSQSQSIFVCANMLLVVFSTLLTILNTVVFPTPWLARLLEFRPLVWFGNISYGLYLWQVPILVLLDLEKIGLSSFASTGIKVVLIFVMTILSYRYLEQPVLRLKKRFQLSESKPLQY